MAHRKIKYGPEPAPEYPVWRTVLNVVLFIGPPVIGFWGLFDLLGGFVAIIYTGGVLLYILVIAPWLTCTHCNYFGRVCPFGIGKLASVTYNYASGNRPLGAKTDRVFWAGWYTALPLLAFAYNIAGGFTAGKLVYIILFSAALAAFWAGRLVYYTRPKGPNRCLLLSSENKGGT